MVLSYLMRGEGKVAADKRTVATDALATLGTIIGPGEKRDAIHLAVEPAVAGESLKPGEHVGLADGLAVGEGACSKLLGIVDPFLTRRVKKGERFWLVVYPGQVTSLRHVWTHPAFPESPDVAPAPAEDKLKSVRWLEGYADRLGVTYSALMDHAAAYLDRGTRWIGGSEFEGEGIPDEFWTHYAAVTGEVGEGNFLSCAC